MGPYGSKTAKPHTGWSNSAAIRLLDVGTFTKKMQTFVASRGVKATRVYKDAKGRTRYHGTQHLTSTGSDPYSRYRMCLSQYCT